MKKLHCLVASTAIACLVATVAACGPDSSSADGPSTRGAAGDGSIQLLMPWSFVGYQVGYLSAEAQGLYEDNGADVVVVEGTGAADTLRRLVTGDVDFAVLDSMLVVQGLSEDPDSGIVAITNDLQRTPGNATYIVGRNIDDISDLATATFGDTGGSMATLYPSFVETALGEEPGFEAVTLDPSVRFSALIQGEVDVVSGTEYEIPHIREKIEDSGLEMATFPFADFGFDPYSFGIVTRHDVIEQNPDLVRSVVQASLEGWQWACENPEAAAEVLESRSGSGASLESFEDEVGIVLDNYIASADGGGIGSMTPEGWQRTHELAVQALDIEDPAPVADVYTDEFLPETPFTGCA